MAEIYLDNAATTRMRDEVAQAMMQAFSLYGNPSSIYKIARESKAAIEQARAQIAALIGAQPGEIYMTSGGSEADNWAIRGVAQKQEKRGRHIITLSIEHHAVLHTCEALERQGWTVTYLPVGKDGIADPAALAQAIRPDTVLVSAMFANNEIGTLQPIAALSAIAHAHGALFHTDAVQAVGHVPVDVQAMGIDLLSLSAHKFYGPKGVGALYIKQGVGVTPLITGGGQEKGRRAGTENVPAIVGMGVAAQLAQEEMETERGRLLALRERLVNGVLGTVDQAWLNGSRTERLPGNANFSFSYIEGEGMLLLLESQGIYASSGSACTSGSLDPSHVLLAIGLRHEQAHGSLRISLGRYNTQADVDALVRAIAPIVARLRQMSPLG